MKHTRNTNQGADTSPRESINDEPKVESNTNEMAFYLSNEYIAIKRSDSSLHDCFSNNFSNSLNDGTSMSLTNSRNSFRKWH